MSSHLLSASEIKIEGIVDSLNHPLASYLRNFLIREKRLTGNEIIIDDIENIEEALLAKVTLTKLFISGNDLKISSDFLNKLPPLLPIYSIAPRTCKKIFEKEKITRVFAIAQMPNTTLLSNNFTQTNADIIVLDGLNISGNIGAIIRTSTAFDLAGIVILNGEPSDLYDRRIIRASRGYIFRIPILTASVDKFIEFCRMNQFKILVMAAQAEKLIDDVVTHADKLAIVLGGEKSGCSDELYERGDLQARIPINPKVESLNVSVAAGIVLYMRKHALSVH